MLKLMTAALAALLLATSAVEAAGGSCAPKFMHMDLTNVIRADCVRSATDAEIERCRCRSNCRAPQTLLNTDEILAILASEEGPLMYLRSRSVSQINRQSYGSLRGRLYCVVIPAAQNSEWGTSSGITARPGNSNWLYSMDETGLPSMEEALRTMYGIVSDHEAAEELSGR